MTLVLKSGYSFDSDASTYIDAVETADGEALETGVRIAINDFVLGCKQDGIWDAIKASCILAGARTTNGALVPLVGTAPTPNNFDLVGDTDYDRKTGLVGDGSTKYLDSNRANNADPQNSNHNACYVSVPASAGALMASSSFASGYNYLDVNLGIVRANSRSTAAPVNPADPGTPGLYGHQRSSSTSRQVITPAGLSLATQLSQTPNSLNITLFARSDGILVSSHSTGRLAFYSIGESLDLAKLDTRVSNLITAIGGAI